MLNSQYTYINQNQKVIQSINPDRLTRGIVIGQGTHGVVSSIGHTKDAIGIALKEGSKDEMDSFPFQLALVSFLYSALPVEQRKILPKFLGVLADKKGKILGVIMDRFGSEINIRSYGPGDIETGEFQKVLGNIGLPNINLDRIYPSLFKTEDGLRLGDLHGLAVNSIIAFGQRNTLQESLFQFSGELMDRPELYTLSTDKIESIH